MPFYPIDTYAVMGNPIAHSQSPFLHTSFAKQVSHKLHYFSLLVDLWDLPNALSDFQSRGGKGLNITAPFKEEAARLVTSLTARAALAQAVNTITFEADGSVLGDNTDGCGLLRDLIQNKNRRLTGSRFLILGAGGAVRGILGPLLAEKPSEVILVNRTFSRANQLVREFSPLGKVTACAIDALADQPYDFILNATGSDFHLATQLPMSIFNRDTFCYDLTYSKQTTPFLRWAEQNGVSHRADGWGMLVEQAAEAFYLWRGVKPDTTSVLSFP